MGFAQDIQELRPKVEAILEATQNIDDEFVDAVKSIGSIDPRMLKDAIEAVKALDTFSQELKAVNTGILDINAVLKMQDQIYNVSNIRDSVGLVAGSIDKVKKVADGIDAVRPILAMQPMIEEILALSVKMDAILDLEEEMKNTIVSINRLDKITDEMSILYDKSRKSEESCANMLNEIRIAEKRIDEKRQEMVDLRNIVRNFSVNVEYLSAGSTPSHHYSPTNNTLTLKIPEGKEGKQGERGPRGPQGKPGIPGTAVSKGDPGPRGRDGKNFKPDIFAESKDLPRFGNRPKGTALLALDESPTMIYFKKSDALNDWTDGQPFGITDGHEANITVYNANRIEGYTVNQLIATIYTRINEGLKQRNRHGN